MKISRRITADWQCKSQFVIDVDWGTKYLTLHPAQPKQGHEILYCKQDWVIFVIFFQPAGLFTKMSTWYRSYNQVTGAGWEYWNRSTRNRCVKQKRGCDEYCKQAADVDDNIIISHYWITYTILKKYYRLTNKVCLVPSKSNDWWKSNSRVTVTRLFHRY